MDYRFESFAPSEAAYAELAALLSRVQPRYPASATWFAREDRARSAGRPHHREVVVSERAPGSLVGVMEWNEHWWSTDQSRFRVAIDVDPAHRARGIGGALLDRALSLAPGDRRVPVECSVREDDIRSVAFVEHRGFRRILRIPQSELTLAAFDPARFEGTIRAVEVSGVNLVSLVGRTGDDAFMRRLMALQAATLRDAPGAAEYRTQPFEVWRRGFEDNPDFVPDLHVVALDGATAVGMTQLWASQATDEILYTGATGVARSHRRRGIATAIKVRALAAAQRLRLPTCKDPFVRTGNSEGNPMFTLNLRLGFVERPAMLLFEREVGAPAGPP